MRILNSNDLFLTSSFMPFGNGISSSPMLIKLRNLAIKSLWHELITYPKPGLVSLIDSG